MLVPGDKGEDVLWGIELTSPTISRDRLEIERLIRPGDKITVVGNPVRAASHQRSSVSLTLADSRTLTERPA